MEKESVSEYIWTFRKIDYSREEVRICNGMAWDPGGGMFV